MVTVMVIMIIDDRRSTHHHHHRPAHQGQAQREAQENGTMGHGRPNRWSNRWRKRRNHGNEPQGGGRRGGEAGSRWTTGGGRTGDGARSRGQKQGPHRWTGMRCGQKQGPQVVGGHAVGGHVVGTVTGTDQYPRGTGKSPGGTGKSPTGDRWEDRHIPHRGPAKSPTRERWGGTAYSPQGTGKEPRTGPEPSEDACCLILAIPYTLNPKP